MSRRGAVPARLLPPAPHEVEALLRSVEWTLRDAGLYCVRESLSSVTHAESGAEVGLVACEALHRSRSPLRVASVIVEGRTDAIDEIARSALLAARTVSYQRIAGVAHVEPLVHAYDAVGRIEAARARIDPDLDETS